MGLGETLWALGGRENGTETLQKAIVAYNEALKEFTRDRDPLDWAGTQLGIGDVFEALGERESGTEILQKAVTAYGEALKEYKPDSDFLDWARTQSHLNSALDLIARRAHLYERCRSQDFRKEKSLLIHKGFSGAQFRCKS